MIIVSNHLLSKTKLSFPDHVVVRVNIAWVKSEAELKKILTEIKHDIYLDYPQGRTKPPKPTLDLAQAIALAKKHKHVKYFAVSNVEDPEAIGKIRKQLPKNIELVPKIETKKGVRNIEKIVAKIKNKYLMLDKEDLYLDVDRDADTFECLIELAREKSRQSGTQILELHGVVFSPHFD
ncbi:MAG: hypothetical protein AAB455_02375 [Patescibacteria group bacterium]